MFETKRTSARLIEAKRLYTQTNLRVNDAAELIGVSPRTLWKWASAEGWPPRGRVPLKSAREAGVSWRGRACPGLLDCPERKAQVAKAWAAAEAQVDAVAALGFKAPEKSAHALAIVVRTLKELSALDAERAGARPEAIKPAASDDKAFNDVDKLRDELARRLRGFQSRGEAAIPDESEPSGTRAPNP
jgi:hypothetical protein